MKQYYVISIIGIFLLLGGCVQKDNKEEISEKDTFINTGIVETGYSSSLPEEKDIIIATTPIISGINISGENIHIFASGKILSFNGLFTIEIPKQTKTWEYSFSKQKRYTERLDLNGDGVFPGSIILSYENIPEWKKDVSDKEKCLLGNYEEYVISKNTSIKKYNAQDVYITNVNFSAFDRQRKQGDICFIRENRIYKISIGDYSNKEITDIINSFKFLQ